MGQGSSRRAHSDDPDSQALEFTGAVEGRQPEVDRSSSEASSPQNSATSSGVPVAGAVLAASPPQPPAAPATASSTMAAAPPAAAVPPAAPRPAQQPHKSTAIIPGWSKALSSSTVAIECQKISQPNRSAHAKECVGVMELEVMKFVAYCGGLTIRMRCDEFSAGAPDGITWGLAAMRPCPSLNAQVTTATGSAPVPMSGASSPDRARTPTGSLRGGSASPAPGSTGHPLALNKSNPTGAMSLENASRKALYAICAAAPTVRPAPGDVLSLDLSPKEDGQPVIVITFSHNSTPVMRAALPCASIAALQMYPFISVMPGMLVSLHEALTPSPLFTWYSPSSATADIQMADLDTCVKYNTAVTSTPNAVSEFHGSTTFTGGRHRWTVQLDNLGAQPGYVFVGLVNSEPQQPPSSSILAATLPAALASRVLGATAAAAAATAAAAPGSAAAGSAPATPQSAAAPLLLGAAPGSRPGAAPGSGAGPSSSGTPHAGQARRGKWGVWVKLPGDPRVGGAQGAANPVAVPPSEPHALVVESQSNHCCITVDLDLVVGYAKVFRNGHMLGQPFTGLTSPISPALAFLQGNNQHLQAGLVNITKLKQLDLEWNAEACSGDLRITGRVISKVSEVFGDYSTVLCNRGFISGVHLWLVKVNNLSEPDSIFIGVCRGCMPLDQDPQDLRDRTYYLSNGVIRVGGRRVATNNANFTKGDVVGVVLDADQGEIVFLRNGVEQGRARGIRGRLYPFVSFDSEGDQVTLLGSYTLPLNRTPRALADMEWDTLGRVADLELSSNCLTATKLNSHAPSTVRGTILYSDKGVHEFHVILDALGPDGIWVGLAPPDMDAAACVGDAGCGWALHSDGDRRINGREEEFAGGFSNGDVLTVCVDLGLGTLRFSRNGVSLGEAFRGVTGPLVAAVTLASEESKVTIQNRPTVVNTEEYIGELRWDEVRAGRDLHLIDGLTVTKMSNEGGDYATVLGTLCVSSGQHCWNVYINHVEDSNLFIGVTVGGHDLNADPQEMKMRTYYLSNGTIRVAGKLVTRCAEPYAEGDLVSVALDMEGRRISFLKNGVQQGAGDGVPEEVWPYVSLDNIMDSITLHSSQMFYDLAHSLKWNPAKCSSFISIVPGGAGACLKSGTGFDAFLGQATVLGLREYHRTEVHSWVVRLEQAPGSTPSNFLVGVAPPDMDLNHSIGQEGCGIGLDYYGYVYINGRYFHVTNLSNWQQVAKLCRGSTARHKGKAGPMFQFHEGRCEVTITLDLKEGTLKFSSGGHSIGTIANVKGPLHAALTLTSPKQTAVLTAGPIGKAEHTAEELVNILKAKSCLNNVRTEAALLRVPRDLFVPRDRHGEAFRDQKLTVRMSDGSTLTLPPPSLVAAALERLQLVPGCAFLDVGCGSGFVTAVAACLVGSTGVVHGIECLSSRLEAARANLRCLRQRLPPAHVAQHAVVLGDVGAALEKVHLQLTNVLIPECTDGQLYDAIYCDTTISEEDLPAFLTLLKPKGRMTAVVEEELVCITRGGQDAHDFQRESVQRIQGDFGELEDPTPWEVHEAIARIKQRELGKGLGQAKAEAASARGSELTDLSVRMTAALARIAELEAAVARSGGADVSPHVRSAAAAGADDTRAVIKDAKPRKTPRMSPRGPQSGGGGGVGDAAGAGGGGGGSALKLRGRQALDESFGEEPLIKAGLAEGGARGELAPLLHSLVQGLGVQSLSSAALAAAIAGAPPQQCLGCERYATHLRGTPAYVWHVTLSQPTSRAELHRLCSRFVAPHPNVSAILGVCVEAIDAPEPMDEDSDGGSSGSSAAGGGGWEAAGGGGGDALDAGCHLWLVEERWGEESLAAQLERGLISWQHALAVGLDMGRALAYLGSLRRIGARAPGDAADGGALDSVALATPLSPLAVAQMLAPPNVALASGGGGTKLSLVPALLTQMQFGMGLAAPQPVCAAEAHAAVLPYMDPVRAFDSTAGCSGGGDAMPDGVYGLGVVLLQLLTEQQAAGLVGAVSAALASGTLMNLVPRTPAAGAESVHICEALARLALHCCGLACAPGAAAAAPRAVASLDGDVLPGLEALRTRVTALGPAKMCWDQVEQLLMMPLAPRVGADPASRRWVRNDFRVRRKLFLEEVAKVAVEGPIHKIEVRRSRCFKDSVATFSGKGQNVWRQPLKVTFIGEAGMDSGGVTREWFSCICSALSRGSLDLFWPCGPGRSQLYVNPLSTSSSHLKRFHFVGMLMAKALLESAARGKELGPVVLNLGLAEPFWKLLLGIPLSLMDLQALDPPEFRSLMHLLGMDVDGLIFENFTWNFQHVRKGSGHKDEPEVPALPSGASPFSGDATAATEAAIALKPGGAHVRVTNANKREYVLLKAHKMLMGAVEPQMTALIDAFHSLVPRELLEKYGFTCLEMQLLVCGEQRIDVADLRASTKYDDGYTGREEVIGWFWAVVETLDDTLQRALLQFWSGSDGMPAEGFGSLEPAFHIVAVDRLYDRADKTARLPAAHTCFRQLDLPRYQSQEELREKVVTAITVGQGYMALS